MAVRDFTRQSVSQAIVDKGTRLYRDGLVIHGPDRGTYRVKGDSGFYKVTVLSVTTFGVIGECSCPARKACSHLFAATLLAVADKEADDA